MIKYRALLAGLSPVATCHTFRATDITSYLENGDTIELAQQIASYESLHITYYYKRTRDASLLAEIQIAI